MMLLEDMEEKNLVAIIHFNLSRELLLFLKRIKSIVTENRFVYKDKKFLLLFQVGYYKIIMIHLENTLTKKLMLFIISSKKKNGRNKIVLEKWNESLM